MFKKLKQKISEEQVPPRGVGGRAGFLPPQVPSKSPPSTGNRIRPTSFTDQNDEGTLTPDKEDLKELIWPRFSDFLRGKSLGEYEVLKP